MGTLSESRQVMGRKVEITYDDLTGEVIVNYFFDGKVLDIRRYSREFYLANGDRFAQLAVWHIIP
jgi:hypothetical protein